MGRIRIIHAGRAGMETIEDRPHDGPLIDFLEREFPDGFGGLASLVTLDGRPVSPDDYLTVSPDDGELILGLSPAGFDPVTVAIIVVVAVVASVGLTLLFMPKPASLTDSEKAQAVYSVTTEANKAKPGSPVPVPYGRCVWTPDYASQSYRIYESNNERRFFLLCAGQGEVDIERLRIGDTGVEDLPDGIVRWKAYKPGAHGQKLGTIAADFGLHEDVVTSGDISSQEVSAPMKFQDRAQARFEASALIFDDTAIAGIADEGDQLVIRKAPVNGDFTVVSVAGGRVTVTPPFGRSSGLTEFDLAIVGKASLVVGPFIASGPGTSAEAIELDLEFPAGLYRTSDKGKLQTLSATFKATLQRVDDSGNPVGGPLVRTYTVSGRSRTPQRRTWRIADMPSGRYSVSLQRTDFVNRDDQSDQSVWTGLKAYLKHAREEAYGEVTLIAIEIIGANELSSQSQQRIFAETVSRIETVEGGRAQSSNPADVMVDIVTRDYGAGQARDVLSLEGFRVFKQSQSGRSGFNGVFSSSTTIWDALRDVALVGRALPHPLGSRLTVVEDKARPVRASVITPDVIAKGSFKLTAHFRGSGAADGITVEYSDPVTFQPLTATWPANPVRPRKVRIAGLADGTEALSMAKYLWRQETGRAVDVEWGMEWDALNFMALDRVGLVFPLFDWGQGAQIDTWSGRRLGLTRGPVPDGACWCVLRSAEGRASEVFPGVGDGDRQLVLGADLPFTPVLSGQGVATLVAWGTTQDFLQDVTIRSVVPSQNGTQVKAYFYDPDFWSGLV